MVLTIHNLAKEYSLLPSQALANATTFDLYVLDVHTRWLKYQQAQNEGQPQTPKLSVDQMKAMIDRVKNKERKGAGKT